MELSVQGSPSIQSARQDFPILGQEIGGYPVTYLDSASSAQKPRQVMEAVRNFEEYSYANIHRGLYRLSEEATRLYEEARETVAGFVGVEDVPTLIFTRGTTESLNLLAYTWGERNLGEGDEIALPVMEHHSNLVPWQQLAFRKGARLRWIEINPDGTLDEESLEAALERRPKLFTFTWVSNVFGTINPVRELADRAHAAGATVILDGAQGVPHLPTRLQDLGVDFLAFSGHKMLAPTGIGVLWGRRELLETMPPFHYGGSMISTVRRDRSSWDVLPNRFEAGTPNISGAIGLAAACRYLDALGMEAVRDHDREVLAYALGQLTNLEGLEVFGPEDPAGRSSVVSFRFRNIHPHDLATLLAREGVCVRAGHHCCQPLMREIGMMGTTRASFYVYNNREDVDRLVQALEKAGRLFAGAKCKP
jgi:cysteine desulfurase/selenocysteine lyase